jgi:hypothetical protein
MLNSIDKPTCEMNERKKNSNTQLSQEKKQQNYRNQQIPLNKNLKRPRLASWIKKQDPTIHLLQGIHLSGKDTYRLKVKGEEILFQALID